MNADCQLRSASLAAGYARVSAYGKRMKTSSPWIAIVIGCIGAICGIASLIWTFYVYQREQPQFIIDCPLDFDKPGLSMGRGIPSNVYVYDNRIGGVTVPCTVINTGEKRELIRRIDSTLSFTEMPMAFFKMSGPISVEGKSAVSINLYYPFDWGQVRSNSARMKITFTTTAGQFSLNKDIVIYPKY